MTDTFNPDTNFGNNGIFGLPFNPDTSKVIILPVPWEVTSSYRSGASKGPQAIYNASFQLDLHNEKYFRPWKAGIAMTDFNPEIKKLNDDTKILAQKVINTIETTNTINSETQNLIDKVNVNCETMNTLVEDNSRNYLQQNKIVGIVGGDHSCPLGLVNAIAEKESDFGILHIDAHADLREAYLGFKYSHASIMNNVMKIPNIKKIVQVGIRDYCEEEQEIINNNSKIKCFTAKSISDALFEGISWKKIAVRIIKELPQKAYISFDIDGLEPHLCPSTGTPVPGGLEFNQVMYLLETLCLHKKNIIGFDLCEVSPSENESNDWDAIVGARVLYNLCTYVVLSNEGMS